LQCPSCHKKAETHNNPWRPFCSERCQLIDLGMWLTGRYRMPVHEDETEIRHNKDSDELA